LPDVSGPLFHSQYFPVEGATRCACVIAGYRGTIASYAPVVRALNERGYSAVVYAHDARVLTEGDPSLLLELVEGIVSDFAVRSAGYDEVICTGASIGAGLGLGVQRRLDHVKFGIYAGAGVSPPDTIFQAPLFLYVRRKFRANGYDLERLRQSWYDVDILPDRPFVSTPLLMVLGRVDGIVRFGKALRTMRAWQQAGLAVQVIIKPALGHVAVIRWYKHNFSRLLDAAESLVND
jgi:hypothetical protein